MSGDFMGDVYGDLSSDSQSTTDNSDDDDQEFDEEISWKSYFLSQKGNEFFCEIDDSFIEDEFNLTGLNGIVPMYDYALDTILDMDLSGENLSEEQRDLIDTAAEVLYGLIHARFILTARGLQLMRDKYLNCDFGRCPRVICGGHPVLPLGQADVPRQSAVIVFCPKCHEVYYPRSNRYANLDGAYFGTTFCHLLLLQHPDDIPMRENFRYIPRIFGFKINKESPYYKGQRGPVPLLEAGRTPAADQKSKLLLENDKNDQDSVLLSKYYEAADGDGRSVLSLNSYDQLRSNMQLTDHFSVNCDEEDRSVRQSSTR